MRRSSKIILAICAFALVYLLMVVLQLSGQSRKEFTTQDANTFLSELSGAFKRSDTSAVLSFAYPDATVAGQKLQFISRVLHNYFGQSKEPIVDFKDVKVTPEDDHVFINADVTANDGGETKYSSHVVFRLDRRSIPHLMGLMHVYDWKVVNVDAQIPPEAGL